MGLDIYLKRYDNFEDTRRREEEHAKFSEKLWEDAGDYDSLSEEKKEEIRKKDEEFAKSLNLDKWGSDESGVESIEMNHPDYPDHYFKIGYFRSSYNGSGIERILRNLGVPTLSEIFDYNGDYYLKPNWELSLIKCEETINEFKTKGSYRVHHVSENIFKANDVTSEKQALDIFLGEMGRDHMGDLDSYSNLNGEFYLGKPLQVLAMIPGTYKIFGGHKCVYVITSSENQWYIESLEIVRDTVKYVLSQKNKEQYYLHWSG